MGRHRQLGLISVPELSLRRFGKGLASAQLIDPVDEIYSLTTAMPNLDPSRAMMIQLVV